MAARRGQAHERKAPRTPGPDSGPDSRPSEHRRSRKDVAGAAVRALARRLRPGRFIMQAATTVSDHPGPVTRFLNLFARVEPGETLIALLLTFNVFLLLTSYYLLKTVREPLILLGGGAEVKSYAAAGQA